MFLSNRVLCFCALLFNRSCFFTAPTVLYSWDILFNRFFSEEYICDRFLCISCLFFHIPGSVFTLFFFFGGSYLGFFVHHTFVYVCDSSSAVSFLFCPKFYMYLRKLYSLMLLKDKFLLYIYDCINPVKLLHLCF